MDLKLTNKVAIVTGAASGMGKSIVQQLNAEGAYVVLLDYNLKGLEILYTELANKQNAIYFSVDITDRQNIKDVINQVIGIKGTIDILINAAGIHSVIPFLEMEGDDFDRMVQVNLTGIYNVTRCVAPYMASAGSGKIVSIASVAGKVGAAAGAAHYAASKGGVIAFTHSLAKELTPKGINVNAIAPGLINTPMGNKVGAKTEQTYLSNLPAGRKGEPEEIAYLTLFLSSYVSDYITGQVINVCGGTVMH